MSADLEFITEVVAAVAPDEVPYVAALLENSRYSRPARWEDHALGSGLEIVGAALAPLLVPVLSAALQTIIDESVRRGGRGLLGWWRRFRTRHRRRSALPLPSTPEEVDSVVAEVEMRIVGVPEDRRPAILLAVRVALNKRVDGTEDSSTEPVDPDSGTGR